jgi:hypothetical protein
MAKRARPKSKITLRGLPSRPKKAIEGVESERRKVRREHDAAVWGALPPGTTRFSLNRHLPAGGTEKVGLNGGDGTIHYNWPVAKLSVDWIRDRWGAGRWQANWLIDDEGKLSPRGKSRVVDIVGAMGNVSTFRAVRGVPASVVAMNGYPGGDVASPPPPAAPAPEVVAEVVDMRVRAAEEIAAIRLKTEREINAQRLEWERERSEERFTRLEQRLEEVASSSARRRDDDDFEEPDEWAWLKEIAKQFAPALKQAVPLLLAKLGAGDANKLGG